MQVYVYTTLSYTPSFHISNTSHRHTLLTCNLTLINNTVNIHIATIYMCCKHILYINYVYIQSYIHTIYSIYFILIKLTHVHIFTTVYTTSLYTVIIANLYDIHLHTYTYIPIYTLYTIN